MLAASWFAVLLLIGWIDRSQKIRYQASREVRDWERKVDAMRRMAEQEGHV
jgi:hypothetical protein